MASELTLLPTSLISVIQNVPTPCPLSLQQCHSKCVGFFFRGGGGEGTNGPWYIKKVTVSIEKALRNFYSNLQSNCRHVESNGNLRIWVPVWISFNFIFLLIFSVVYKSICSQYVIKQNKPLTIDSMRRTGMRYIVLGISTCLRGRVHEFKCQFHCFLVVRHQANCLTPLCFTFIVSLWDIISITT